MKQIRRGVEARHLSRKDVEELSRDIAEAEAAEAETDLMETREEKARRITAELAHACGSQEWREHWTGYLLYTDGVNQMAELCGAHWLIDIVASVQGRKARNLAIRIGKIALQVWRIKVKASDSTAVVECWTDTPDRLTSRKVYAQRIPYTDFPLDEFTLWVRNRVILLPSEN